MIRILKVYRKQPMLRVAVLAACVFVLCLSFEADVYEARATGPAKDEALASRLKGMAPRAQLRYLEQLGADGQGGPMIPFYMGNAMYALGNLDSAVVYFQKAVEIDSMFSKAYVNLGIAYDGQRLFNNAKDAFTSALRADPNDVLAYCHLGFLHYSKQQYGEAMESYKKALEINPESAQAHYYMGLAFADAHVFQEALREWELVMKLQPDTELGSTARENVKLINQYLKVQTP